MFAKIPAMLKVPNSRFFALLRSAGVSHTGACGGEAHPLAGSEYSVCRSVPNRGGGPNSYELQSHLVAPVIPGIFRYGALRIRFVPDGAMVAYTASVSAVPPTAQIDSWLCAHDDVIASRSLPDGYKLTPEQS